MVFICIPFPFYIKWIGSLSFYESVSVLSLILSLSFVSGDFVFLDFQYIFFNLRYFISMGVCLQYCQNIKHKTRSILNLSLSLNIHMYLLAKELVF